MRLIPLVTAGPALLVAPVAPAVPRPPELKQLHYVNFAAGCEKIDRNSLLSVGKMTFPIPARLKTATLHHRLQAIAAATLAATSTTFGILLLSPQESLAANYCVYSEGRRVCLDSVFGPRAKRRIYFTVNGVLFVVNKNCYSNDYQPSRSPLWPAGPMRR